MFNGPIGLSETSGYYRLDGHTPVRCTWEEWAHGRIVGFEGEQPYRVAETWFGPIGALLSARVSTVFLAMDHAAYTLVPLCASCHSRITSKQVSG